MDLFLAFVAAHNFSEQIILILPLLLIGMEKRMWPNSGHWDKRKTSGKVFSFLKGIMRRITSYGTANLFLDRMPTTPIAIS